MITEFELGEVVSSLILMTESQIFLEVVGLRLLIVLNLGLQLYPVGLSIGVGLVAALFDLVVFGEIGCSQMFHKRQHSVHYELMGGQSPFSLQSEEYYTFRVLPGGRKHEIPLGGGLSLYGFEGRAGK